MRRSKIAILVAAVAVVGLDCGVQEHNKAKPLVAAGSRGGAVGAGNSGPPQGTGGQLASSGGVSGATVGTGTGGNTTGSGGGNSDQVGTGGGSANNTGGSMGNVASAGNSGSGTGGAGTGTGGRVGTGGAPASGITINIAGTVVPKEKAIVFIHFGHSNMMGHGVTPANLHSFFYDTQPGLWIYRGANTFVPAAEPTAPSRPSDPGAGPGMAILKTAAAAAPAGYHFISIGRGEGSAPSTDFVKGNLLYSTVMDRAMELKGKVTFGAIFIMMGITERHLPTAQQAGFPMRMKQIIADMRADLGEPNLPVLHTEYEMQANMTLAPTGAVGKLAIPMINSLPGLITNLVLIPTAMCTVEDDHHFTLQGHKLWAELGIMLMQQRGWFPWQK